MERPKQRGRPTKRPKSGDKSTVGLRIPSDLKIQLEEAAASAGRNLSGETEYRLQRSFDNQGLLSEVLALAYGDHQAAILLMLAEAMKSTGVVTIHNNIGVDPDGVPDWTDNPYAFSQVRQAMNRLMDILQPEGESTPPQAPQIAGKNGPALTAELNESFANTGNGFANSVAMAAIGEGATGPLIKWGRPITPMLGPLVARLKANLKGKDKKHAR